MQHFDDFKNAISIIPWAKRFILFFKCENHVFAQRLRTLKMYVGNATDQQRDAIYNLFDAKNNDMAILSVDSD